MDKIPFSRIDIPDPDKKHQMYRFDPALFDTSGLYENMPLQDFIHEMCLPQNMERFIYERDRGRTHMKAKRCIIQSLRIIMSMVYPNENAETATDGVHMQYRSRETCCNKSLN